MLELTRIDRVDGQPFATATVWVRADLAAGLSPDALKRRPLSEQLGVQLGGATQTITAVSATTQDARVLGVPQGAPLLRVDRTTWDADRRTMIVVAPVLASSLGSAQAAPVIAVMSLSLVIAGAGVVPFAMIQREFQQSRYFVVVLTCFLLGSGLTAAYRRVQLGCHGAGRGKLVEQTCSVGLQFGLTRTRPRFGFDGSVARSALAFGLPVCGANALSWLRTR